MQDKADARSIWAHVQKDLRALLGENAHRSWTARLTLHSDNCECVRLLAPSRFISSRIISDYGDKIQNLWAAIDNRQVLIGTADDFAKVISNHTDHQDTPLPAAPVSGGAHISPETSTGPKAGSTALNIQSVATQKNNKFGLQKDSAAQQAMGRFTFDNFVVGAPNELAHAVARTVASGQNKQYNPILIHGPHGMGKTHLLTAVKHKTEQDDPQKRVKLISAEEFVVTFVAALRSGNRSDLELFKRSLRETDLLIIDDAHFIAEKPSSQEELLHTLMHLVENGKQVLLATDRHPHAINKASDRLKSYLCSGLLCDIGPADYELRRRILDRLIERKRSSGNPKLAMPEKARDHLAARINATPRDLEGAFNQVVARSEFLGTALTLENVQEALSHSRYNIGRRPTVDRIQKATSKQFNVNIDDMLSKRRERAIARPRQVAMYLAKTLTTRSLPDIGRRFGGRDHTTVIHAVKRIEALRAEDPQLDRNIEAVIEALRS